MSLPELEYDTHTPRTAHPNLAATQFLEFFNDNEGQILNIAAGRTNLQHDLRLHRVLSDVVSLDPSYTEAECQESNGKKVYGIAQELPFEDDTFTTSLIQFGLQHFGGRNQVSAAIMEAIRVTKPTSTILDNRSGTILLGPVFRVRHLTDVIFQHNLQRVCGIQGAPGAIRHWPNALPTLVIKKVAELDASVSMELAEVVADSEAMKPSRKEIGERVSRLFHGRSRV